MKPLTGVPERTCKSCFGESGGTLRLYVAQRHPVRPRSRTRVFFDVLNELEVRLRSVNLGLRWRILLHEQIEKLSSQCKYL